MIDKPRRQTRVEGNRVSLLPRKERHDYPSQTLIKVGLNHFGVATTLFARPRVVSEEVFLVSATLMRTQLLVSSDILPSCPLMCADFGHLGS